MSETPIAARFRPLLRMGGKGTAAHQFAETLRGIALDGAGRVYAVGDAEVKVFDEQGALQGGWQIGKPGFCVAVDATGRVWVGQQGRAEIYDREGQALETMTDPGRLGRVTAIAFAGGDVFMADANARWIRRYDGQGRWINDIGSQHRKGGFHIPNGAVDFAIDGAGILHVANPGMHRVERYRADGTLLGHFGRFGGNDPAGFPGCCNPTNVALDGDGRVIVSEKAGPRVKAYDAEGNFLSVVDDTSFDPAAKNMDVAVDGAGRIYVADTAALEIHVFAPAAEGSRP